MPAKLTKAPKNMVILSVCASYWRIDWQCIRLEGQLVAAIKWYNLGLAATRLSAMGLTICSNYGYTYSAMMGIL